MATARCSLLVGAETVEDERWGRALQGVAPGAATVRQLRRGLGLARAVSWPRRICPRASVPSAACGLALRWPRQPLASRCLRGPAPRLWAKRTRWAPRWGRFGCWLLLRRPLPSSGRPRRSQALPARRLRALQAGSWAPGTGLHPGRAPKFARSLPRRWWMLQPTRGPQGLVPRWPEPWSRPWGSLARARRGLAPPRGGAERLPGRRERGPLRAARSSETGRLGSSVGTEG
jgi:hypothetical protein